MKNSNPLLLLGALGALSAAAGPSAAAVDTSEWKCESCPAEQQGVNGTVEVGVGVVSATSTRFADFTGIDRKGASLIGSGNVRYRGTDGLYGNFVATDLTPDALALAAEAGRAGRFVLRLGYDETPRYLDGGAATPFLGAGSNSLTLPVGFAAATTNAMPLNTSLQPVELGYKRSRLDLGAAWLGTEGWVFRLNTRHVVRNGSQRTSGAFFATTSQLVAPVDQTTDEFEASASYSGRVVQTTLAYQASIFSNAQDSLTWKNPFTEGIIGSGSGQLALAPSNQFHQIQATLGWQISPQTRASADIAAGRMSQDAAYLAPTLNSSLDVPGLPALSLHGLAATFNASLRLTTAATERLRLNASLSRDERRNETPIASYPSVSTDMFLGLPRTNQPYGFTQDRLKLGADYRGPASLKLAVGSDIDVRQRTLQEVRTTREASVFGRASAKPLDNLSLALKLSHAERSNSGYQTLSWVDPTENPLLRKYNQADRVRDKAGVRADLAIGETANLGFDADLAIDDYRQSVIGLTDGRSLGVGSDLSIALTDVTQLQLFGRVDRTRSRQVGSQQFAQPDWSARNTDRADVLGVGLRHAAIKDKLDVGADLTFTRSSSDIAVDNGAVNPAFPTATTALDSVKLFATYRLRDNVSLTGGYWYERYESQDWRLAGVLPATAPNLLTFGEQPPHYSVNLVRLSLRYRF